MGAIKEDIQYIEVISKFTVDGTVIPIKLKVQDEDGEYQSFMIKGYHYRMQSKPQVLRLQNRSL